MGLVARLIRFFWARWADYNSGIAILDLFDWKTTIFAAVGGVAMTMFGATNMAWSVQGVVLAAVVAAACIAIIVVAIRFLLWQPVAASTAPQETMLLKDTPRDWSLRELFGYLAPHLPLTASVKNGHNTIGTKDERWNAIGDQVLKQLSVGRLQAVGVGYRNMTTRLQAAPIPADFWRTAVFTYWFLDDDGAGVLQAKNADNIHYSDIEVDRQEAIAIWPHSLGPSIDRTPFTEVLSVATSLGWDFSDSSLNLLDLQEAVRQAGSDGVLTMWGKIAKYTSNNLLQMEPFEKIPAGHWAEYHIHLFAARSGDNFNVYSWSPAAKPFGTKGYVDLHAESSQVMPWLRRDAVQFKGKTKAR
jgi:hypothetical protein